MGTTTATESETQETTIDPAEPPDATAGSSEGNRPEDAKPLDDPCRPPHRLRDLDRRGRLWAVAFALALVLAPVQAYLYIVDDWEPHGDPARIGLQTWEVGSGSTPLTGQPSSSAVYVETDRHVDHLGPLHYYLMAGPVRAFGFTVGMLATSVVIISTCALLSAWAAFRRLGPSGGVVAAFVIGLTMFTTGAPSLMTPISSNIAGYPLFCAAVLLWCVLRGDLRLLPLAAGVTTFAAQAHLSVVPAVTVLVPAAVAGLLWHWGRDGRWRTPGARRQLARWAALTAAVSLALWSPMLFQEVTNDPGNLTNLVELAGDDDRPTVGLDSAVRQVTNTIGLPPLLGSTDVHLNAAAPLLESPTLLTKVSALMVVGLLGLLAVWWRDDRERRSLVVMVVVLVAAGLTNGSSTLASFEAYRIAFYHWVWPLTFFVATALLLGAGGAARAAARDVARRWPDRWATVRSRVPEGLAAGARPGLLGVAVLAVVVPAVASTSIDRPTNDLREFRVIVERRYLTELTDQILAHEDRLEGPVLLLEEGANPFARTREAVVLRLIHAGLDARVHEGEQYYVANRRIAWPGDEISGGLLIVQDHTPTWREIDDGELIADVLTVEEDWPAAVDAMATELGEGPIQFGPGIAEALDRVPPEWVVLAELGELTEVIEDVSHREQLATPSEFHQLRLLRGLDQLHDHPAEALRWSGFVEFLLDHPLDRPRLSETTVDQVRAYMPEGKLPDRPIRLRAYLLAPDEVDIYRTTDDEWATYFEGQEDDLHG